MWGKLLVVGVCLALTAGCAIAQPSTSAPVGASSSGASGAVGSSQPAPSASGMTGGTPSVASGAPTGASQSGTAPTASQTLAWPTARPKPASWNPTPANAPVSQPYTVNGVVLVNRVHPLTSTYAPPWAGDPGLSPEFSAALKLMQADAKQRGLTLKVRSGYRSYATQAAAYASAKASNDPVTLDLYFAKPGMSEHQTGLAADLTDAAGHRGDDFLNTPEAHYLAEHATDFGFIVRYPLGGTPITGYAWEPWHMRWVGKDVSSYFAAHPGLTLEQYLGEA